ncbi:MOB kinase activator-like 4 [Talaromyces islandicus]|uniref:MOB kinase activator-like 4 n=1 Tax=Talaromyces islandicus TaxID=28573 RepID=A0A0U1LUN6_TALIS|nr:MOB kinase activator-like 4 [Talaromyces islandicus]
MDFDFVLFDDGPPELHDLPDFDADCDDDWVFSTSPPLIHPTTPPLFSLSARTPISFLKAPATTSISRKMAATAAAVSPSSSPRLPSPPPFPEVQIGPQSPTVSDKAVGDKLFAPLPETDDGSTRRIRPGTKAADMASGLPLIPLSQLDSPFQLQEHLKALYHNYTMPSESDTIQPITREVAVSLAHPPDGVERSLWLYELCRFLTMKVNNLIIAFFAENPPCSAESCPEMRASEWQYLCAVHDPPKPCCAIDYCCHTIDWATNILTSPKYFPSRLTLGSDAAGGPQASMRYLTNIFRRLYRIFAHAWFQHRDVFRQVENTDGLYVFFKTVCDVYELIPQDNYTIPGEAEQSDGEGDNNTPASSSSSFPSAPPSSALPGDNRRISVLRKDQNGVSHPHFGVVELGDPQPPANISAAATTRRHKHSPSTGSSVTTITEALEEPNETAAKEPSLSKVEENKEIESQPVPDGEVNEVVAEETKEEGNTTQVEEPAEKVEDAEPVAKAEEPEEKAAQSEAEAPNVSPTTDSEPGAPAASEKAEADAPTKEETSSPETVEDVPGDTSAEPKAPLPADQETAEPSQAVAETSTKISVEEKPAEDDE